MGSSPYRILLSFFSTFVTFFNPYLFLFLSSSFLISKTEWNPQHRETPLNLTVTKDSITFFCNLYLIFDVIFTCNSCVYHYHIEYYISLIFRIFCLLQYYYSVLLYSHVIRSMTLQQSRIKTIIVYKRKTHNNRGKSTTKEI